MRVAQGRGLIGLWSAFAFLAFALAPPVGAQVPDAPAVVSCIRCRISIERIVTLGSTDGPGALPAYPERVAQDSRGRFYIVLPYRTAEPPFVFERDGQYIGRLGRAGEGPGEFMQPMHVAVTMGDTVHVLDEVTRRHTVLSPSHDLVRTSTIPLHVDQALILDAGRLLVNGRLFDADNIGKALHLIDLSGKRVASFDEFFFDIRDVYRHQRLLARSHSGVWAANRVEVYAITLWDSSGRRLLQLRPASAWFRPYARLQDVTRDHPPQAMLNGIWEDPHGLVWVVGTAGDPRWKEGLGEELVLEGSKVHRIIDDRRVYDGVIEVIDPEVGRVVTSRRFEDRFAMVIGPGIVGTIREDDLGWFFVDVSRVTLTEPHQPPNGGRMR